MKKFLVLCGVCVAALLCVFFLQRPVFHEPSSDVKFGLLPLDDWHLYEEIKLLGFDYVMISNYDEKDLFARLKEAEKQELKVYLSAGTLHPDDYKRMSLFAENDVIEGFFLDEPHLHTSNYSNDDIEKWITWSKETFPDKKIFIATPRKGTYDDLSDVSNLNDIGFQPDTYPINGLFTLYGTQRRLVEQMRADGFEVQPIIQTHALSFYESSKKRKYIDFFASLGGHGLIDWPTPEQVAIQIRNVSVPGVNIMWFYPGEDIYIKWTQERMIYMKDIFMKLKKQQY